MSILDGRQVVATPGTSVPLWDVPFVVSRIDVFALAANTGVIAVGTQNVSEVSGAESGLPLSATEAATYTNIDISTIWIDAAVAGEGVRWGATIE